MSQKYMTAALLAVMMLLVGVAVARDYPMGIAPQQNINFTTPIVVGGTVLPAGNYTVSHEMNGQNHVMIFKQVNGTAEAKANCTLVPLKAKADQSQHIFTTNAKNQRVLREMTFAGDKATHVLVD